jgi:hypothetical protein
MIEDTIKEYEDEIKILVYNKHDKQMVFNQYLMYQQYIRNKELEAKNYPTIKGMVIDYIKK